MSNNVSSNYGALFGNRVVPNNAAPLNANTAPAVLNQPQDQALISANPAAYANASVTASPDMRGDLLSLRKELMEIFETPVHLFLFVKVREKWSEDPERYREMGLEWTK